jgi:hypothetical protein
MVIRFSEPVRRGRRIRLSEKKSESATVIILPVVRIERFESSEPAVSRSQRRRRRRRASHT